MLCQLNYEGVEIKLNYNDTHFKYPVNLEV